MIRVGITIGDVNGIGPEVALKAALQHRWPAKIQRVLIGCKTNLLEQADRFGINSSKVPDWTPASTAPVAILAPVLRTPPQWKPGQITVAAARASVRWIEVGTAHCMNGDLDALVTAPICKEGWDKAGITYPGHTELLANLTGTQHFAMMLFGGPLRVLLATRHIPLSQVAATLNPRLLTDAVKLALESLPWLGEPGRVGICGLNPHAGDGGLIGREEKNWIAPLIRKLRKKGWPVEGPVPADTIFHQAAQGRYQAVVALYHDQGLGPLKLLAFDTGVNVTLGLPIVRTSPDHGTAFDIAGQNKANPSSMVEAVRWAVRLAGKPNPWKRTE